jgi:hypothetical protein
LILAFRGEAKAENLPMPEPDVERSSTEFIKSVVASRQKRPIARRK